MALYRSWEATPDKQCSKCSGQLAVVAEYSSMVSGDTFQRNGITS